MWVDVSGAGFAKNGKKMTSHELDFPWNSNELWQEANQTLQYLIKRYGSQLNGALNLAVNIKKSLQVLFPLMETLCIHTCPWCPNPCCLSATVWFDFTDLLFLNLNGLKPPPSQPQRDAKSTCRHIGPRGCTCPRMLRPWTCAWYLCATQLGWLKKADHAFQDAFKKTLENIRVNRKRMETEFIRIVYDKGVKA
jgi:hypothetical protein